MARMQSNEGNGWNILHPGWAATGAAVQAGRVALGRHLNSKSTPQQLEQLLGMNVDFAQKIDSWGGRAANFLGRNAYGGPAANLVRGGANRLASMSIRSMGYRSSMAIGAAGLGAAAMGADMMTSRGFVPFAARAGVGAGIGYKYGGRVGAGVGGVLGAGSSFLF